jgi:hypothetical protein
MKYMTSLDKKILQGGWTHKQTPFPRGYFNNQMENLEVEKHISKNKGNSKKCAKTKGEHTLVVVQPTGTFGFESTKAEYMANLFAPKNGKKGSFFSRGATVSVCTSCGKIITKWN